MTQTQRRVLMDSDPSQKVLPKYPKSGKISFNSNNFKNPNDGSDRKWLLYSATTNSLFCYSCCLFPTRVQTKSSNPWGNYGEGTIGYRDFLHQSRGLLAHEQSQQHFSSTTTWMEYKRLADSGKTINHATEEAMKKEVSFWRQVLRGILDAIIFLAKNNLAFQGKTSKLGQPNCGNFLSLIELLSKYYPPLKTHVNRITSNKVSYMSDKTQNEFISLAGSSVRASIISKIQERKYFTIMFDATPDVSHKEQISQIIRTVKISEKGCEIEENFIDFIHFDQKTGLKIAEAIVHKLKEDGLDIMNCRGQGYDCGSNMAGTYQGVQARIKEINPKAVYVPCAAHSLNLVGQHAASKILPAKLLLGQIQTIYVFFSGSPWRWNILAKHVSKKPKCLSSTRWSSRCEAVSIVADEFHEIIIALMEIAESEDVNAQSYAEANSLLLQMRTFKFLLGINVWKTILERINITNLALQKKDIAVSEAAKHLKGLVTWIEGFKLTGFDKAVEKARKIADASELDYESGFEYRVTRGRKPKRFENNKEERDALSNLEKFKIDFFDATITKLLDEFKNRFQALRSLDSTFSFLWGKDLCSMNRERQIECISSLCQIYEDDFEIESFKKEIGFLPSAVEPFLEDFAMADTTPLQILDVLVKFGLKQQFRNIVTALTIFLTLPVSVASNERAFSKLKIVKGYRRSTMGQSRLSDLSILSIEHEHVKNMSFEGVIDKFASMKCRQVSI